MDKKLTLHEEYQLDEYDAEFHEVQRKLHIRQLLEIEDLLKLETLDPWMRAALAQALESKDVKVTIDVRDLVALIDEEFRPSRRGRPRSVSIDLRRAEALWDHLFDGYEPRIDAMHSQKDLIAAVQLEAAALVADHQFRLCVEELFPATSTLATLEKSLSAGIAQTFSMRDVFSFAPYQSMNSLDQMRDQPQWPRKIDPEKPF